MTMRVVSVLLLVSLLVGLSGCVHSTDSEAPEIANASASPLLESAFINTVDGSVEIRVELARTPKEITTGLMHRKHLESNHGMLFIFDHDQQLVFWMKNTLIPLDIIYINSSKHVVDIISAQPCTDSPCTTYPSRAPARYVIEVNEGFSTENNIQIGDFVSLSDDY